MQDIFSGDRKPSLFQKGYYPPLLRFLLKVLMLSSLYSKGADCFVISILCIFSGLVIAFTRRFSNQKERYGLLGFVIFLGLPGVIAYSRFTCADALFLPIAALVLFFISQSRVNGAAYWWAIAGFCFGLGMLAKWLFWVFLAIPLIYFVFETEDRGVIKRLVLFALGAFLGGGWWYAFFLYWKTLFLSASNQPGNEPFYQGILYYFRSVYHLLGFLGVILFLIAAIRAFAARKWRSIVIWVLGGVLFPLVVFSSFGHFEVRYLLGILIPLTIFLCEQLNYLISQKKAIFAISALVLTFGLQSFYVSYSGTRALQCSDSSPFARWEARLSWSGLDVNRIAEGVSTEVEHLGTDKKAKIIFIAPLEVIFWGLESEIFFVEVGERLLNMMVDEGELVKFESMLPLSMRAFESLQECVYKDDFECLVVVEKRIDKYSKSDWDNFEALHGISKEPENPHLYGMGVDWVGEREFVAFLKDQFQLAFCESIVAGMKEKSFCVLSLKRESVGSNQSGKLWR